MSVTVEKLYEAYTRLDRQLKERDYEVAIKTAKAINQLRAIATVLAVKNDETEAMQAQCYALAQTDQFTALLDVLSTANQIPKDQQLFHKAYCLYRLQRHAEALKIIASVSNPSANLKNLEAQAYFRLEEAKCAQIYEQLFYSSKESSTELLVNLMASLTRSNQVEAARNLITKHKSILDTSYDLVYNGACALIEGNDLVGAEAQLKLAETQCRRAHEESKASQDELNTELAPILTQLAYVCQRRGHEQEAASLYEKVLSMDLSDLALIAVCNNNLVSLRGSEHAATSLPRLTNLSKTNTQEKLSQSQKRIVLFNRCILLLQVGKFDDLQKLTKTLEPTSELTALIQAATLIKKGQPNKAIETLREFVRATLRDAPATSRAALRVQLSLAQIQLGQGNVKEAISSLKSITSIHNEPAYLATLVVLYQKIGELASALNLLDDTASKLMANKKTMDVAQITAILRKSAELKLANSMWTQATETLQLILQLNPTDTRIKATLALALASVDPSKAEQFLGDIPKIVPAKDVGSLEVAPAPQSLRSPSSIVAPASGTTAATTSTSTTATNAAGAAKKKRKKRKNKPAKLATPGQQPDPERWIPKQLRRGFKKRGPVAKQTHAAGHQGTAANEAINKANTAAPSKSAPAASGKVAPRGAPKKRGGRRR